jgi:hypothetical protein
MAICLQRPVQVVRRRWGWENSIVFKWGVRRGGPQGAILPSTVTNPLEVPTPNLGHLPRDSDFPTHPGRHRLYNPGTSLTH